MAFRPETRRRVLAVGLAGCVLLAVVDQAAPAALAPLRAAVGAVAAPVQELLTGSEGRVAELTRQRDDALRRLGGAELDRADLAELRRLRGSASTDGRSFVPAQVIGYTPGTTAGVVQQVTIDVGSADGIRANLTVVCADGLVGRTTAVTSTSATVQLLTDPRSVVGVRVGPDRLLASVSSTVPAGIPARSAGLLTVRAAGFSTLRVGDQVTTLGSIDETPFVRGVPVGRIVAVDPDRGQGAPTAVVQPAVDPTRLDLVGVILPPDVAPRRAPVEGDR